MHVYNLPEADSPNIPDTQDREHRQPAEPRSGNRSTQAERSARTRGALLESAARGLSRYGYGNLILERVASDAGYTRGALYHQFKDKEDLALAVIDWVKWYAAWTKARQDLGMKSEEAGCYMRYCSSVTCSNQSTTLPSFFS